MGGTSQGDSFSNSVSKLNSKKPLKARVFYYFCINPSTSIWNAKRFFCIVSQINFPGLQEAAGKIWCLLLLGRRWKREFLGSSEGEKPSRPDQIQGPCFPSGGKIAEEGKQDAVHSVICNLLSYVIRIFSTLLPGGILTAAYPPPTKSISLNNKNEPFGHTAMA